MPGSGATSLRLKAVLGLLFALALATPATAPGPNPEWMVAIVTQPAQPIVEGVTDITGISQRGDVNRDGFVVIAFIDTGINPYSVDFDMVPGQPNAHPSAYISGYPATVPAINLNCQ